MLQIGTRIDINLLASGDIIRHQKSLMTLPKQLSCKVYLPHPLTIMSVFRKYIYTRCLNYIQMSTASNVAMIKAQTFQQTCVSTCNLLIHTESNCSFRAMGPLSIILE